MQTLSSSESAPQSLRQRWVRFGLRLKTTLPYVILAVLLSLARAYAIAPPLYRNEDVFVMYHRRWRGVFAHRLRTSFTHHTTKV